MEKRMCSSSSTVSESLTQHNAGSPTPAMSLAEHQTLILSRLVMVERQVSFLDF